MTTELLSSLMLAVSPSGSESRAVKIWDNFFKNNLKLEEKDHYTDKIGNSIWSIGNGPVKVLISAHGDEVNARVSRIDDSGFLRIIYTGGICRKALLGSEVIILNHRGELIKGIIGKTPMHLEDDEDKSKSYNDFKDLRLDVGAESKEEVEALGIRVGDPVVYGRRYLELGKHRICGCGLDDKAGLAVCADIAQKLQARSNPEKDKYTVFFGFMVQEETGLRGATIAAQNIKPDISIDLDVTWSITGEYPDVEKDEGNFSELGKGAVIEFGADKSPRIGQLLIDICEREKIPYQFGVSRSGGTNTDAIQKFGGNCETMHVAIPNTSMHTAVEECDMRDLESASSMILHSIVEGCL